MQFLSFLLFKQGCSFGFFKKFLLSVIFCSLKIIYLGVVFEAFFFLGIVLPTWICGLVSDLIGKTFSHCYCKYFFYSFSLSSCSGIIIGSILYLLQLLHHHWIFCFSLFFSVYSSVLEFSINKSSNPEIFLHSGSIY